jgi:hypothetical protein
MTTHSKSPLANPTPYFLELLTHQTGDPMHRASVEQHGEAFTRPGNLVSNGAYLLEAFTPNDKIVMTEETRISTMRRTSRSIRSITSRSKSPRDMPAPL